MGARQHGGRHHFRRQKTSFFKEVFLPWGGGQIFLPLGGGVATPLLLYLVSKGLTDTFIDRQPETMKSLFVNRDSMQLLFLKHWDIGNGIFVELSKK